MGRRLEADDPKNIIDGKRKRTISDKAKAAVQKVKGVLIRKSSKSSTNDTTGASSVSSDAPSTSVKPPKRSRQAIVLSEEEDEAELASRGVTDVEEVDAAGQVRVSGKLSSRSSSSRSSSSSDPVEQSNSVAKAHGLEEESDEQELSVYLYSKVKPVTDLSPERMQSGWRTAVYAFFQPDPVIEYRDGRKCHVFRCTGKGCTQRIVRYLDTKDAQSTGNMRKHVKKCWGEDVLHAADEAKNIHEARTKVVGGYRANGSITASFARKDKANVTYSHRPHTRTETRAEIVRWVSESNRPFAILKDRGLNCLLKTGRPTYYVPHPTTVSRDVKTVFAKARNRIAKMLKSHSGIVLAAAFAKTLDDFGIGEKVLSITCDNASPNDTMIDELADLLPYFPGAAHRTRCFAHIVNLVAKSLLRQFDVPKKKAQDALDDAEKDLLTLAEGIDLEDLETRTTAEGDLEKDNVEGWVDEVALLDEEEAEKLSESVRPVRLVLVKIRKLAFKIIHSSTILLPEWRRIVAGLEDPKLTDHLIPRDVSTRWNSTFDMLHMALRYRKAVDAITSNRANGLRQYELSGEEWKIASQLCDVLEILKHATTFFSRSTPNLATVIPAMDLIDQKFTTDSLDKTYEPAIRVALNFAKKTINRYYTKTDDSELYRIAMVLHPRHKLTYFKNNGWEDRWIKDAEKITRDEFERNYPLDIEEVELRPKEPQRTSGNMFDNLAALAPPKPAELRDELDRYLSTDVEAVEDVISWWTERQAMYPRLSRMALDYLTIPAVPLATSVDVERVFSLGRLQLTHVRNRMATQTTRALLCLGRWSLMGFIHDEDILKVVTLPEVPEEEGDSEGDVLMPDGWDDID
ncbi:hypothetical protein LshimejAT787_0212220 [Lyophyllum shimeji]|uniref:HAT C-terminal dimerisation domain-containing protein n=1 Tax=Lyophyllum shimeji TaxID=47721 RepID=A0A9P3PHU2_LYOSH|nr:hypothetical protein LshimejAT787_0212220 [Lyophyllum shimeji]